MDELKSFEKRRNDLFESYNINTIGTINKSLEEYQKKLSLLVNNPQLKKSNEIVYNLAKQIGDCANPSLEIFNEYQRKIGEMISKFSSNNLLSLYNNSNILTQGNDIISDDENIGDN